MRYGMGQNFNPHTLRDDGVITNFSYGYNINMLERKCRLEKLLGKKTYKKIVNKVKSLSR